jgi:hypothetical protein
MALRFFLVILLVLSSPGMFLHYIGEDCGGDEDCPLCLHAQGAPAEGAPTPVDCAPGDESSRVVVKPIVQPCGFAGVSEASPRAPPATSI